MRNFRIIRILYKNGSVYYKIQRECKYLKKYVLWGPKVWKTYVDVYDGNWSSHTGWCFNVKYGDGFNNEKQAGEKLKKLMYDEGYVIDKIEVL